MPIPIRNLYFLLCYAWRRLPESGLSRSGSEVGGHLTDLFARFLSDGFLRQSQRGLDRAYMDRREELPLLRGRGLWLQTETNQARLRGRVVCEYQDLSSDTQPEVLPKTGPIRSLILPGLG